MYKDFIYRVGFIYNAPNNDGLLERFAWKSPLRFLHKIA